MKKSLSGWTTRNLMMLASSASAILVMAGCLDSTGDGLDSEGGIGETKQEIIYGNDHRTEVFDHSDANLRRLAEMSTATLIEIRFINASDPNHVTFVGAPLLKNSSGSDDAQRTNPNAIPKPLCQTPAPRFADDVAVGSCTGTLIDDDLLLTAGHCVAGPQMACGVNGTGVARFVFNYRNDAPSTLHTITTADVFSCTQVISFRNDSIASGNFANDYAIVKLDRAATPRFTPAPVRTSVAPLATGLRVGTMGSGERIPHKIDSGGTVIQPGTATTFLQTTSDIFGGASGSGVYELGGYQLAGIVLRGLNYTVGPPGSLPAGCVVPTVCGDDARCSDQNNNVGGNVIGYVGVALADFCFRNPGNARLCGSHHNAFPFSASNTNSATQNTINHFVYLEDGATIDATTCSAVNPGASGTGDTFLNLASPADPLLLTENVAGNDDDSVDGCGLLSRVSFTVPPMRGGLYRLQAGCFSANNCSGTVAYTITGPSGGSFSFDAANTANGTVNTRDLNISVQAGNVVTVGTCSPTTALGVQDGVPAPVTLERTAFGGDTFISLVSGSTVVANDDACGTGVGSQLKFTATASGTVKLRAGCFSSTSCSGTVAYTINRDTAFYARSNTNSGTVNTLNTNVPLRAGDQITVGTCGVLGSAFTGNTVLSLFSGSTLLKFSDDNCVGTSGSMFTHRAASTGAFQVRSGCSSNFLCTATPVIRVTPAAVMRNGTGSFFYGAGVTNSATRDTTRQFLYLREGQQVRVTTCNAGTVGDTFVRVFGPNSQEVAFSDDDATCTVAGVDAFASTLTFSVGLGQEGSYEIRGGCFADTICQGVTTFQSL